MSTNRHVFVIVAIYQNTSRDAGHKETARVGQREKYLPPQIRRLVEGLGLVGTFNFSCAESNPNQLEQRILLICVRFGT